MKRLKCYIKIGDSEIIGNYVFDYVVNLGIVSSWETFTDRCTIQLPDRFRENNEIIAAGTAAAASIFKRGDPVTVFIGYDPNPILIDGEPAGQPDFQGYITDIMPDSPFTLMCEDAMWLLKQTFITSYSSVNLTLESLLEAIMPDTVSYLIEFLGSETDINLGQFRIKNATVADVLQELKKKYGLISYIRNGVLIVGSAYSGNGSDVSFAFQHNVIESNLEYKRKDDVNIVVRGISILPNNSKIELSAYYDSQGDIQTSTTSQSGENRTLTYYNLSQTALDEIIRRELPRLTYEGYFGSFVTFGEPLVRHGDYAVMSDKKFPERDGRYVIKSVEKTFGQDGFRQVIALDAKQ